MGDGWREKKISNLYSSGFGWLRNLPGTSLQKQKKDDDISEDSSTQSSSSSTDDELLQIPINPPFMQNTSVLTDQYESLYPNQSLDMVKTSESDPYGYASLSSNRSEEGPMSTKRLGTSNDSIGLDRESLSSSESSYKQVDKPSGSHDYLGMPPIPDVPNAPKVLDDLDTLRDVTDDIFRVTAPEMVKPAAKFNPDKEMLEKYDKWQRETHSENSDSSESSITNVSQQTKEIQPIYPIGQPGLTKERTIGQSNQLNLGSWTNLLNRGRPTNGYMSMMGNWGIDTDRNALQRTIQLTKPTEPHQVTLGSSKNTSYPVQYENATNPDDLEQKEMNRVPQNLDKNSIHRQEIKTNQIKTAYEQGLRAETKPTNTSSHSTGPTGPQLTKNHPNNQVKRNFC